MQARRQFSARESNLVPSLPDDYHVVMNPGKRGKGLFLGMVAFAALAAQSVLAQPTPAPTPVQEATASWPAFEVAAIRPSNSDTALHNFMISPNRFRVENGTAIALIRFAYNVKSDAQLPKEPRWIESERFDIDAKIADPQAEAMKSLPPDRKLDQYRLMLRSLLLDRFKLQVSRQMKEIPVYALVVGKKGSKLRPAKAPLDPQAQPMPTLSGGSRGQLRAGAVSMAVFTDWLSGRDDLSGRVVLDETGLQGTFDFTLDWAPDQQSNAMSNGAVATQGAGAGAQPSPGGSILTALQEQLGLKLESTRDKVEVLVIDRIDRPSDN
jgi:uncharacterized protein (TIGR03435 family)